jgi:hypothetical protein
MHVSIIQAGTLLARLGRPEVENCIKGLEQYSYAYEECMEQAAEITRVYNQALAGEHDLQHMASVLPRRTPVQDHPLDLSNGSLGMQFESTAMVGYRG